MELTMQQKLAKLREPLPAKSISWRVGNIRNDKTKGQALPYIKPRVIQDLLDDIIGPQNWRNRFIASQLGTHPSLICEIDILIDGQWVTKSDGAQLDSFGDEGNDKEVAIKGAYSDSFKRAAVMWGIGRYLYEFEIPWVELREGKYLVSTPRLPAHMLPANERSEVKAAAATARPADEPKAEAAAPAPAPQAEAAAPAQPEATPAPAPSPAKASAPAPAPTSAKATPPARAAAPAVSDEDAEVRERSAAAVDAAMEQRAAAPAPAPTPAAAPAPAAAAGEFPPGLPEGLNDEQLKTVRGLIEKINKKLPTAMLRNYVRGPKAAEALPESARAYVLKLLDQADGKATA